MIGGWTSQREDPEGSNRVAFYILIGTLLIMIIYRIVNNQNIVSGRKLSDKEIVDTAK